MRWLRKAEELLKDMPNDEDAKLAVHHFLHAADIRKAAYRSPRRPVLMNSAAQSHRLGVKHYNLAVNKG